MKLDIAHFSSWIETCYSFYLSILFTLLRCYKCSSVELGPMMDLLWKYDKINDYCGTIFVSCYYALNFCSYYGYFEWAATTKPSLVWRKKLCFLFQNLKPFLFFWTLFWSCQTKCLKIEDKVKTLLYSCRPLLVSIWS